MHSRRKQTIFTPKIWGSRKDSSKASLRAMIMSAEITHCTFLSYGKALWKAGMICKLVLAVFMVTVGIGGIPREKTSLPLPWANNTTILL